MAGSDAPVVSVVIPTYNQAHFLGETLASVRAQTVAEWEAIVVNNHSDDDTKAVAASFADPRIVVADFRNDGVVAASRNVGMKVAKGAFIAFCDSDDLWEPDKLALQLAAFHADETLLLVATNMRTFPGGYRNMYRLSRDVRLTFASLMRANRIANSSVMVRREVLDTVGFLDEDPRLRTVEDYDYWLRILHARDGSALLLKRDLLHYRVHQGNLSLRDAAGEPSSEERVRLIFDKYRDSHRELYDGALRTLRAVHRTARVKDSYYRRQLSLGQLFRAEGLSLPDKLGIVLKDLAHQVYHRLG